MKLTPTTVQLTNPKYLNKRKKNSNRSGYADTNGQVFLPPNPKRESNWKKKMEQKGHRFE